MNTITKLFFLVMLALPTTLLAAGTYNQLYVFGDSLSDNGNFIALSGLPSGFTLPAPYSGTRLSDGPLAIEKLAELTGTTVEPYYANPSSGTNFSVSGARAGGTSAIDLTAQVDTFLASQNNSAPNDALYLVFIGGNDIRDIRNALLDELPREERIAIYSRALDAMEANIRNLIEHGARNLLVVYAPDISGAPETIKLASSNPKILRQIQRRGARFNYQLKGMLKYLRFEYNDINSTGIKLAEFDFPAHLRALTSNGSAYNLNVIGESCITTDFDTLQVSDVSQKCGTAFESIGDFLYIDQLHLSASGGERFGRALYNFIPAP